MSGRTHGVTPRLVAAAPPGAAEPAPGPATDQPSETAGRAPRQAGKAPDTTGSCGPLRGLAPVADQIAVALIDKAAADLQRTHDRTQLSKTDIVNRALSLYEFIDAAVNAGAEVIVRQDGHANLLKLLLHPGE